MDTEELKKNSALLQQMITGTEKRDIDYIEIDDYVFKTLGVESDSIEKPEFFYKNFIHLMCHVYNDVKEIEDRLSDYRKRYDAIKNTKSNRAEFERRKLIYFCDINKNALKEIDDFIAKGIPAFLSDLRYDALKRECEKDGLSDLFYNGRYKYARHRDYYSIDYPYGSVVKISQFAKEKYAFEKVLKEERRLLSLERDRPEQFQLLMDRYVEDDKVIENILERVAGTFHLVKRREIFETLNNLFSEGKYQSFITLGLIQIEGLFDDYCEIRYGESENQGTLVEKVQKTLEANEYNLLRMYPYFAFDVPLLRNEVAHKGMLKTEDAKRIAYDLVLYLNTLTQMVKSESIDKFVYAIMTHEKIIEWEPNNDGNTDNLYDTLLYELLMFDKMANNHFWNVLRNPEDYRDEIEFYRKDVLPENMIDLPGIIDIMTRLMKSEGLWKAMHRLVNQHITPTSEWIDVEEFARRMKNQYIGILEDAAKTECIEVAKIVG